MACKGIVYKVDCKSCDFTYIGVSKRSWNSRGPEHKLGMCSSNDSFIIQHAETTDHDVHPNYVQILERDVDNLSKRLFLESWHSTINTNCVNERKPFPRAYLPINKAFKYLAGSYPNNIHSLMKAAMSDRKFRKLFRTS